jgi:hypothetical protein
MDSDQSSFLSRFNFQRIVIIIAIIMLILAMVFIGYALYRQSSEVAWPPKIPKCPDYWTVNASGSCKMPTTGGFDANNCEFNGIPGKPLVAGQPMTADTCPLSQNS